MGLATVSAAGVATLALWISVSVQGGFPSVAGLVGRRGALVGGLLVIGSGAALGMVWTTLLEVGRPGFVDSPRTMAVTGGVIGIAIWMVGIAGMLPLFVGRSVPLVHLGALGALCVYGAVFGAVYGMVCGAFGLESRSWGRGRR